MEFHTLVRGTIARAWRLDGLGRNPGFIRDAQLVAAIPDRQFTLAIASVDAAAGFLGPKRLDQLLEIVVDEADQRDALVNCLGNLSEFRVGDDEPETFEERAFAKLKTAWRQELVSDVGDRMWERIRVLLRPHRPLDLYNKAAIVAARTGSELDSIDVTCDIRPVFDAEEIAGVVPVTTMTISFQQGGSVNVAEVRLSPAEFDALEETLARARMKLDKIKGFIATSGLASTEAWASTSGD